MAPGVREAVDDAMRLVVRLPGRFPWHLSITDEDDEECPAALNIFVDEGRWPLVLSTLNLGIHTDRGEDFVSWTRGMLTVSLIELEEQEDDREPDA